MLQEHCRGRLAALRADLRDLFIAHTTGNVPTTAAMQALNRALNCAPGALLLQFDPVAGFTRSANHPVTEVVEHAMAAIANDAASLLSGDQASVLASCEADGCQRFFLRTHAPRQWCSTRCSDRVRAARAYARKREIQGAWNQAQPKPTFAQRGKNVQLQDSSVELRPPTHLRSRRAPGCSR